MGAATYTGIDAGAHLTTFTDRKPARTRFPASAEHYSWRVNNLPICHT